MSFENLHLARRDSVALIRFSKPADPAHSIGTSFLRELREALARVGGDPTARVLVVIGKGRSFSAGADLREVNGSAEQDISAFLRAGQSVLRQIMDLDIITIAAVNGLALGGGLELALACDIRWAHVSAVFGFPEARLGLLPGWGGMSLLSNTAPASLCAELIASGELIGARRACETGLVSRVFESPDFESDALAEANRMADRFAAAAALMEIKPLLRQLRGEVDLEAGNHPFLRLWTDQVARREPVTVLGGGANDRA